MRNLNVDQVSISRVGPSEVDHVFEILDQATKWLSSQGMNHWNGVHTKERLLAEFEASHVLLARTEELGPIGTVTISFATPFYHQPSDRDFWSDPNANAAYVRKLAVLPQFMKRGLASMLLASAEEDGRNAGALFARLDTNPAFPGLVDYYEDHGYTKMGERSGNSFFEKVLVSGVTLKSKSV